MKKLAFFLIAFSFIFSCTKESLTESENTDVNKPVISYTANEIISAYSSEKFDIDISKGSANKTNTLESTIDAYFTPYAYGFESLNKSSAGYSLSSYSFSPIGKEIKLNIVSPQEFNDSSNIKSINFSSSSESRRVLVRIDGFTDDVGEFIGDSYKATNSENAESMSIPVSILSEQPGILRLNVSAKESSDSEEASSSKEINIVVNPLEIENVDLKIEKGWSIDSEEEEGYILPGEWVRGLGRYVYFSFDKESHEDLQQVVVNIYSTTDDELRKELIHTMTIDRTFPRQPWTTRLNGTFIVEFYGKSSINGDKSLISSSKLTIPNVFPFLYSHSFDCIPDTLYCGREYIFDLSETVDLDGEIEKFVFNFGKLNRELLEKFVRDYSLVGKKGYYRKHDERRRGDECADVFRITFSDEDFPEELPDDSTSYTTEFMVWADDGEAKKEDLNKEEGNSFLKRTVTLKKVKEPVATFDMFVVNNSNEVVNVNGGKQNIGALITFDASHCYSGRGRKIVNYRWFQKDAAADDSEYKLFKETVQPSFNWATSGYHKNNSWIGKKDFKLQIVCEKIGNSADVVSKDYCGRTGTKLTLLPNSPYNVSAYSYNANYRFLTVKEDNANPNLVTYFPLEVEFKLGYEDFDKDVTKIGELDELVIDPSLPELIKYDFYIQKEKENGEFEEIEHIVSKNGEAFSYQESKFAFATQKESYVFGNEGDLDVLALNELPGKYRIIYQITKTKGIGEGVGVYCDTSYLTLYGKGQMIPAIDIKMSDGNGEYVVIHDNNSDTLYREDDLVFAAGNSQAYEGKNIVKYLWVVGDDNSNGGFGIAQDPNTGDLNAIGNNVVLSNSSSVNARLNNVAFKAGVNYIWLGILDDAGNYKVSQFRLNIANRAPEITDIQMPSFIVLEEEEDVSIVVNISVRDRDMTGLDEMTFKYYIGSNSTTPDDNANEEWVTVNDSKNGNKGYVEHISSNGMTAEYRLHLAFNENTIKRGTNYLKIKAMDIDDGISEVYQESQNFGKKLNFYKLYFRFMKASKEAKERAEEIAKNYDGDFAGFATHNLNPSNIKIDSLNMICYSAGIISSYDKGGVGNDPDGDAWILSALYFRLAAELEGIGSAEMDRYVVTFEKQYCEGTGAYQDLMNFNIPKEHGYIKEVSVTDEIGREREATELLLMDWWHHNESVSWVSNITTRGLFATLFTALPIVPGGFLISPALFFSTEFDKGLHSYYFGNKSGLEASAIAGCLKKYIEGVCSGERATVLSCNTTKIRLKVTVRDTYEGNKIVHLKAKDFHLYPIKPTGIPEDVARWY